MISFLFRRPLFMFASVWICLWGLSAGISAASVPANCYTVQSTTVYDVNTKLTWQRNLPSGLFTWTEARQYCATLSLSGGGWRLPTIQELMTIVDTSTHSPTIDSTAFPGTPANAVFWTSTVSAYDADEIWRVFFGSGTFIHFVADDPAAVRCVR